jgi:hypothetical protein
MESLGWRVGLEKEQLRDDEVRDDVVPARAEGHDAIHQQPREDLVRALAAAGALDDVRDGNRRHGCG